MAFAGKVALITGGSKGIGAATALNLASQGASVVVNYGSDSASADALIAKIGDPQRSLAVQADAGSVSGVEKMVAATVEKFGKLDVAIANAGLLPMIDLASITEADYDKTFNLNVKGPLFLAQKAAPHMAPGSHIVLLSSSVTAYSGVSPAYLLYNSTKGAIDQMTRLLAKSLAPKGISVNAVAPGPTATDLFMKGKSEQVLNGLKSNIPFGRLGEPNEIADVIAFMCSSKSSWVTGQVLRANGGFAT
ncbi:uncharacterized protein KY384_006038 [Bacidia gigantensis]|uniref:uncharacterized protein n=1 Tax=Bacidia gigantensis TaxID=2732470 RepID=UPI001D03DF03|nr:uncharacterized protein KY384_006038 [Bacidia gigantensis]KAG8529401.1 hypothetical protein KY384_006038 [Bacidia gigantensis]